MPNSNNDPSWWSPLFQVIGGACLLLLGYSARQVQESIRRVYFHVEGWRFYAYDKKYSVACPVAEATGATFGFTLKAFSTKRNTAGLHRMRIEFVQKRWGLRRVLAVHGIKFHKFEGTRGEAALFRDVTWDELELPSRQWVRKELSGELGSEVIKSLARCNLVCLVAETAEGNNKRWRLRRSIESDNEPDETS